MDGPSAELVCSIIILIVFFYCVSRRHLLLGQVCQLGRNWQFPLVQGNTAAAAGAAAASAAKNRWYWWHRAGAICGGSLPGSNLEPWHTVGFSERFFKTFKLK